MERRVTWEWNDEGRGRYDGYDPDGWGSHIAKVMYAEEGEAEGGLAAFCRFYAGALAPGVKMPPLSPAGWWWQGTTEERGIWVKGGPFPTAEAARDDADRTFSEGAYLKSDG